MVEARSDKAPGLHVLQVVIAGKPVTLLAITRLFEALPGHAIVGQIEEGAGGPRWDTFRRNPVFVAFLTAFMRGQTPHSPDGLYTHHIVRDGAWHIVDPRAAIAGDAAPGDIVGSCAIAGNGRPQPETFTYDGAHALCTAAGPSPLLSHGSLLAAF